MARKRPRWGTHHSTLVVQHPSDDRHSSAWEVGLGADTACGMGRLEACRSPSCVLLNWKVVERTFCTLRSGL